jgi:hypothetical protein
MPPTSSVLDAAALDPTAEAEARSRCQEQAPAVVASSLEVPKDAKSSRFRGPLRTRPIHHRGDGPVPFVFHPGRMNAARRRLGPSSTALARGLTLSDPASRPKAPRLPPTPSPEGVVVRPAARFQTPEGDWSRSSRSPCPAVSPPLSIPRCRHRWVGVPVSRKEPLGRRASSRRYCRSRTDVTEELR